MGNCWDSNPYQALQNPVDLPLVSWELLMNKGCHRKPKTTWQSGDSSPDLLLEKFLFPLHCRSNLFKNNNCSRSVAASKFRGFIGKFHCAFALLPLCVYSKFPNFGQMYTTLFIRIKQHVGKRTEKLLLSWSSMQIPRNRSHGVDKSRQLFHHPQNIAAFR